jgi:hypothetical protein
MPSLVPVTRTAIRERSRRRTMWSRLRGAVAGIAEQAGIEVPGLDTATSAVTDLAGTAADAGSALLAEVGASDAVATAGEAATVTVGEASSAAGGALDALKGHLAP